MTRAASGAQRSDAAALIIISTRCDEDFARPDQYFASSFFVPRTPAGCERGILWAWSGRRPGSPVPIGPGGRTAKHLKSIGSTVPFCGPSRDARVGRGARAYGRNLQNHRTTEPASRNGRNQPFLRGDPVLRRFCGSTAHIKWGGYCLGVIAAAPRPDPRLDRAAAGRKFPGRTRLAGAAAGPIGTDRGEVERVAGNDGFPPFFGGAIGHVGTAASECASNVVVHQGVAAAGQQPAGLAARLGVVQADPRGVAAARRGGTPPSRAALVPSSFAQPIFQVSIDLRVRCDQAPVGDRGLISRREKGSGDRQLGCVAATDGAMALIEIGQQRVGVMGAILGVGGTLEWSTLWGGSARVN